MLAPQRRDAIAARLRTDGRVLVTELARDFRITTETVRRDLDALEEAGVARRVHGGAVSAGRSSLVEPAVAERASANAEGKRRIARLACERLLASGATSVLLDAGTTTAALADEIVATWPEAGGPRLVVATHSPAIAQALAAHSAIEVHAIGGRIRAVTGAAVGAQTVLAIGALRPDLVILGTNGLDAAGLTTPDPDEAAVKTAIVRAGRRVAVLADGAKLDEASLVRFAGLDAVDVLLTDTAPSTELAAALDAAGCEVHVA
ncbi:DeoR/GlpR family DNA-binding transcription regulator [Agrococcus carbonis]|uniref:Lactose phosphotransferase system repressor n=1 Tax=Agrococcus carbonis TaxID=684552 RepID=A0A1H1L013_9MICO|nr:DeoR/GlpR family DNA-binding transcription regulator [Agrococcus carbonis]SDR67911.1 transcriptional regulator, DeoR family [Agrococcus carbonis]